MAGRAELVVGGDEEVLRGGRVRRMACGAVALADGRVDVEPLERRLIVAAEARVLHGLREQLRLARAVRIVAIGARAVLDGGVLDLRSRPRLLLFRMAPVAE